uniref:Alpha/beta hydrolase family/Putative lysophospholipase, putative n=1 Tax=Theileria annulata TaxID=5874 RepID=A0A3B0MR05_THEAN
MALKKGKAVMSYFVNRQGLRIRTYACEVDNPKGKIFLVHGIKSHFFGDYVGYNVDWYFKYLGEYKSNHALELEKFERKLVFNKRDLKSCTATAKVDSGPVDSVEDVKLKTEKSDEESNRVHSFNCDNLDGRDLFELTPRYKYEGSFVEYLNNLGYSTYSLDHQSHGLSESATEKRCYFVNFDDVCYDLIQFITLVKKGNFFEPNQTFNEEDILNNGPNPNITTSSLYKNKNKSDNYYLFGLSMGGNVVLRTMQLYNLKYKNAANNPKVNLVDALVCFAGMIDIDFQYTSVKRLFPLFRLINKFAPKLRVGKTSDFLECLTMFMRYHDPTYFSERICLKMALMIYDSTKTLDKAFDQYPMDLPTLFLHSSDDTTCDVKGPRHLMKTYFSQSNLVKFQEIEGGAHVITSPLYTNITGPLVSEFLQSLNK